MGRGGNTREQSLFCFLFSFPFLPERGEETGREWGKFRDGAAAMEGKSVIPFSFLFFLLALTSSLVSHFHMMNLVGVGGEFGGKGEGVFLPFCFFRRVVLFLALSALSPPYFPLRLCVRAFRSGRLDSDTEMHCHASLDGNTNHVLPVCSFLLCVYVCVYV
jgi:hypothetical protein